MYAPVHCFDLLCLIWSICCDWRNFHIFTLTFPSLVTHSQFPLVQYILCGLVDHFGRLKFAALVISAERNNAQMKYKLGYITSSRILLDVMYRNAYIYLIIWCKKKSLKGRKSLIYVQTLWQFRLYSFLF